MTLVTVPNYPLVKVGMWSASTGKKAVTKEDLEAIVEAHESNLLDKGVIKKGHLDPRHSNPAWDGDPVYGQVDNLRLSDDGTTLMGDYVNVPKELADSLPSAYPNRSVEIAWGVQLHDVAGKVTKKFKAALAGVALLGRTPPAVKGLGGPQVSAMSGSVECESVGFYSTTDFSLPGGLTANALRTVLDKAISDTYKKPSTGLSDGDYPWMTDYDDTTAWFRLNAGTFQVSYSADAQGNITLGDDVVEVVERRTFVPVNDTPAVPQTNLSEKEADHVPDTSGANDTSKQEDPPMSEDLKKLRDKLGLPETATEEEILAAAAEATLTPKAEEAPKETAPAATPAAGAGVTVEAGTAASEGGKHAAPADDNAPKTIAVSAVAFSELMETSRSNAAELANLKAKDRASHVESLVTQFSAAGKIHPTEVGYFREQLTANEAPTVAFLSERTGIPVAEIGSENATVAHFSDDAYGAAASYFNLEGGK